MEMIEREDRENKQREMVLLTKRGENEQKEGVRRMDKK